MLLARGCDAWTAFCVGLSFSQEKRRGGCAECHWRPIEPSAANAHTGYRANRHQYALSGSRVRAEKKSHAHSETCKCTRAQTHIHALCTAHTCHVTHTHVLIISHDDWFQSAKLCATVNTQMGRQRVARLQKMTVKKWYADLAGSQHLSHETTV